MNKYLHYCAPIFLGTIFGFFLGYEFRRGEFKTVKNNNLMSKEKSENDDTSKSSLD